MLVINCNILACFRGVEFAQRLTLVILSADAVWMCADGVNFFYSSLYDCQASAA
jgi:uncharacterized protein YgiB involved in biofilm formation